MFEGAAKQIKTNSYLRSVSSLNLRIYFTSFSEFYLRFGVSATIFLPKCKAINLYSDLCLVNLVCQLVKKSAYPNA